MAGYSDETALALWDRADREAVISAAIEGRRSAF
jgi:hypothetical protein